MINNIFLFLLNVKNKIFRQDNKNTQVVDKNIIKDNNKNISKDKLTPLAKNNKSTVKEKISNSKKNNEKPKKIIINKDHLLITIKRNLFFIEELILSLSNNNDYIKYYEKILDLKYQSESSYKVLIRLTEDKPYYRSTIILIYEHTMEISRLRTE